MQKITKNDKKSPKMLLITKNDKNHRKCKKSPKMLIITKIIIGRKGERADPY